MPVHALAETADFIRDHGEDSLADHWKLGDLLPSRIVVPKEIAAPGEQVVDGVTYLLDRVTETEVDFHLTVKLPELGVCFAQDLLYSGTHLYLTQHLEHWTRVLEELLVSDYDLFLPGHGLPADKNEVARNIEYLAAARQAISDGLTGDAFKEFLLRRYPERDAPASSTSTCRGCSATHGTTRTAIMKPDYTVGQYLVDRLTQLGLGHLFSIAGDYSIGWVNGYVAPSTIEVIEEVNELNAGYAADATPG